MRIDGISMSVLLDTGSQVIFIREDVYKQLGSPILKMTQISLRGFGRNDFNTLGCFKTVLQMDDEEFELESIVQQMVVISGSNIFEQAELMIKQDSVIISKISRDIFLTQIEILLNPEVDLIIDKSTKSEIAKSITSYKPDKTKDTEITMTIVIKKKNVLFTVDRINYRYLNARL